MFWGPVYVGHLLSNPLKGPTISAVNSQLLSRVDSGATGALSKLCKGMGSSRVVPTYADKG